MLSVSSLNNYQKGISFGTIERKIIDSKFKRLDNLSNIKMKNNSYFFREDLPWNNVINHIIKGNKARKLYCYACSDGSEPYSIAILLISKLGYDKAQKYFPIIARDIDPFVINKAKSGYIDFLYDDFEKINKYQDKAKMIFFEPNCGKYPIEYKVCDNLKKCVNFELGNILKDKDTLDYDGSIIFFRNVWPYLKKAKQLSLINTFKNKFSKETSLVIGDFDINTNACDEYFQIFPNKIINRGLWQVKPKIFQINNIKKNKNLFADKLRILIHNLTTETYCRVINKFYQN